MVLRYCTGVVMMLLDTHLGQYVNEWYLALVTMIPLEHSSGTVCTRMNGAFKLKQFVR